MSILSTANAALRDGSFEIAIKKYKQIKSLSGPLLDTVEFNIQYAQKVHAQKQKQRREKIHCLDVIVPVFNALDDVKKALHSLQEHGGSLLNKTIVINDGSDSQTSSWLQSFCATYKGAELIENEKNIGYTKSINIGIKESSSQYILLLNSDAAVTKGSLEKIIAAFDQSPKLGIVGAWSNAASWQSVPDLHASGGWATNNWLLEENHEWLSEIVAKWAPDVRPRMPVINGFCFAIRRRVIERIGYFDEVSFPRGYGEEDDYCIRARLAGYELGVAENAIILHAKSKNFTAEGRKLIVEDSKKALKKKHGKNALKDISASLGTNEDYLRSRTFLSEAIRYSKRSNESWFSDSRNNTEISVAWLQPHMNCVGGIRRCIEMSNRMSAAGLKVQILTPDGVSPDWMPCSAKVSRVKQGLTFDVVILSDPDMALSVDKLSFDVLVVYHLAAYSLYREKTKELDCFYSLFDRRIDIANSAWTAEFIDEKYGIESAGVFPGGIDKMLFRPAFPGKEVDVTYYGSRRLHKGTHSVRNSLRGVSSAALVGVATDQQDLVRMLCKARVFVSGAWHEGFNFMPLEAMACGVPVVMTDCGGSREYARDGINCSVVQVGDEVALRAAVCDLLENKSLRARYIENGIKTAWEYNWDDVTEGFLAFLNESLLDSRRNNGRLNAPQSGPRMFEG